MRKRILVYPLLFLSLLARSQEFPTELANSLQSVIDDAVQTYSLKGVAGSVILSDNRQWTGGSGIAAQGVPVDTSKLFLFASLTKTFIAATILQLYEEGELSLGDSVGKYIGPLKNIDGSEPIRDLLNMSTGYADFTDAEDFWPTMTLYPDSIFSTEQVLDNYVLEPVSNEDNHLIYRNTNFLLLGMVVESITGNTIGEELKSRFFEPLHLNNTFFVPVGISEEETNGGWGDIGAGFQYLGDRSPNSILTAFGAAAGLASTPQEMARWIKGLNEGGILEQSSLDSMRTLLNGTQYANGNYYGQGLGTQALQFDGYVLYGHKGNLVHHSLTLYSPDSLVAISFVINHTSHSALDETFHKLFKETINYLPTSVSERQTEFPLVYPNPVQNTLKINLSGFDLNSSITVSIVDYLGKTIMKTVSSNHASEIAIDFSQVKSGNYLLVLEQDHKRLSGQIVKE